MDRYLRDVTEFIIKIKKEYMAAYVEMLDYLADMIGKRQAQEIMDQLHNGDLSLRQALDLIDAALK